MVARNMEGAKQMTQQCCGNCKWFDQCYYRPNKPTNYGVCLHDDLPNDIVMNEDSGKDCQVYEERKECDI